MICCCLFAENNKLASLSLLKPLGGRFQALVLVKDEGKVPSDERAEHLLAGLDLLLIYKTHRLTLDI